MKIFVLALGLACAPASRRPGDAPLPDPLPPPADEGAAPAALETLERTVKDIGAAAEQERWDVAHAELSTVERALDLLATRSTPDALVDARGHLAELRREVELRRPLEARFAANALSLDTADLIEHYEPMVSADLERLEALLRQALLEGLAGRPEAARAPVEQAREVWLRIREHPELAATSVAAAFERSMVELEVASDVGDAAQVIDAAQQALEGVGPLEVAWPPVRWRSSPEVPWPWPDQPPWPSRTRSGTAS